MFQIVDIFIFTLLYTLLYFTGKNGFAEVKI